jgi:hypothetical protein
MTELEVVGRLLVHWREGVPIGAGRRRLLGEAAAALRCREWADTLLGEAVYGLMAAHQGRLSLVPHPALLHDCADGRLWLVCDRSGLESLVRMYRTVVINGGRGGVV